MPQFGPTIANVVIDSLPPVVLAGLQASFSAPAGEMLPVKLPSPNNFYTYNGGNTATVLANSTLNGFPMYARNDQTFSGNGGAADYRRFTVTVYTTAVGTIAIEAISANGNPSDENGGWQAVTTPQSVGTTPTKNGLTGVTTYTPGWTTVEVPFLAHAMRAVFKAGPDACSVRLAWGRTT